MRLSGARLPYGDHSARDRHRRSSPPAAYRPTPQKPQQSPGHLCPAVCTPACKLATARTFTLHMNRSRCGANNARLTHPRCIVRMDPSLPLPGTAHWGRGTIGAWRSLASALPWGGRGRRVNSARPDKARDPADPSGFAGSLSFCPAWLSSDTPGMGNPRDAP